MKKILAVLLSLLLLCSCQKGPDAAEMADALCRLYVHGDTAVSSILKDWDTESIRQTIEENLHEQMKENLQAVGAELPDEESLKAVTDSILEARKRIPLEAELVESDKEKATVKITIGALDLSAIDAEAAQSTLQAVEGEDKASDDYVTLFIESYLNALQQGFEEADTEKLNSSFEVSFVKRDGLWLPEDMNGFISALGQLIRR